MILKDKVAVVTGGSRGIGRAITLMLAKEGAKVVFTYLTSKKEADSLVREINNFGGKAIALEVDIRDFEKTKLLIEKTKETFGALDILVNNAGIVKDKALMLMSKEVWSDVLDTDLNGIFNVTRNAIITFLKQKSGKIVNITSIAGIVGMARQTNYAAAKAGIIGFTKALAKEVGNYNINVNAVAPGFIETDMIKGLNQDYRNQIKEHIPLARLGLSEEVANAVKFLLSDAGDYITGQVIVVDGGLSIK